jgi:glycosyltransferase involved in cell wall biosynthesis
VSVLVHLPLADEVGLPVERARTYLRRERAALTAVRAVICPSRHTANRLAERYGRRDAVIAAPGVRPAAPARGSSPPHLLCLGSVTPTKNQLAFLAALADLTDQPWNATVVGSTTADPGYAAQVAATADRLGHRVRIAGPLTGADLQQLWLGTDLLVLCSRVETYGLVVAEALAHGIPAVVPAGTGAVEALGEVDGELPGLIVEPGDLGSALRAWLTQPALRADLRRLALRRRSTLPTWGQAADVIRGAVGLR